MQQDYNFPIFHYAPPLPHFQIFKLHNLVFPFWKLGAFMLEGSRKSCCLPPRVQTLESKIRQLTYPGSLLPRSKQWFRAAPWDQHARRAIKPSMTWSGLFRATCPMASSSHAGSLRGFYPWTWRNRDSRMSDVHAVLHWYTPPAVLLLGAPGQGGQAQAQFFPQVEESQVTYSKPRTELTSIAVIRAFNWEERVPVLVSVPEMICSFFFISNRHMHIYI